MDINNQVISQRQPQISFVNKFQRAIKRLTKKSKSPIQIFQKLLLQKQKTMNKDNILKQNKEITIPVSQSFFSFHNYKKTQSYRECPQESYMLPFKNIQQIRKAVDLSNYQSMVQSKQQNARPRTSSITRPRSKTFRPQSKNDRRLSIDIDSNDLSQSVIQSKNYSFMGSQIYSTFSQTQSFQHKKPGNNLRNLLIVRPAKLILQPEKLLLRSCVFNQPQKFRPYHVNSLVFKQTHHNQDYGPWQYEQHETSMFHKSSQHLDSQSN